MQPPRFRPWYLPTRFHYAWVVVTAAVVNTAVMSGVISSFGVFLVPLSEDMGWSRGLISLAYAIQFVAMAAASPVAGWLGDRIGARRALAIGAVLFTAGLVLAGRSFHLWQFYLSYGVLLGTALSLLVTPLHVTVGLWFWQKLGMAIGIVLAATGLGPLIFAPLVRHLITVTGWANTLVLTGAASGVLLLSSAWFIRNRPSDMGLHPYGVRSSARQAAIARPQPGVFYTGNELNFSRYVVTTQPFFWLILIHFLGCVSHSFPLAHVVAMASDSGQPNMAAASVIVVISGFAIISRLGMGILADRIGGKATLGITIFIQATAIPILLLAHELWTYYLFAIVFALGYGGEMVVFPVLDRQYYGDAPIGAVYGYQMMGANLGMALGGYLGGFLFDLTGDYSEAIWMAFGVGLLGAAATLRLASPRRVRAESRA